jgi:hypothetical protein
VNAAYSSVFNRWVALCCSYGSAPCANGVAFADNTLSWTGIGSSFLSGTSEQTEGSVAIFRVATPLSATQTSAVFAGPAIVPYVASSVLSGDVSTVGYLAVQGSLTVAPSATLSGKIKTVVLCFRNFVDFLVVVPCAISLAGCLSVCLFTLCLSSVGTNAFVEGPFSVHATAQVTIAGSVSVQPGTPGV